MSVFVPGLPNQIFFTAVLQSENDTAGKYSVGSAQHDNLPSNTTNPHIDLILTHSGHPLTSPWLPLRNLRVCERIETSIFGSLRLRP